MARRGAMTAIQAALAGLSGGAAGYVRQRELQKEQDRLKAQEERQQQMDMATLLDRGWMTPEQFTLGREEMKATEPAQRMRLGEQELVRARTPQQEAALERGRQATVSAKAGAQEGKARQSAIAAALDAQGSRISPADRALINAGLLEAKDVLPPRGGGGAPSTASLMRDINDQVARFIAANTGRTRKAIDPETRAEVERPIDVRAEAEQLRQSLLELYGLRVPGGAESSARPRYNNIPQVLDQLGLGGGTGAPQAGGAAPRTGRPLEFTTATGRTYRLPEE